MALRTSLDGRVRNLSLPKAHALLPLLEAVVNGIQAIDMRYGDDTGQGTLKVRIQRDLQEMLVFSLSSSGRAPLKPIVGFAIEDDGVGFTPENMLSFETLDSDFKAEFGCRGVGRLLWLKAFDCVEIQSTYRDDAGELKGRKFKFSVGGEVEQDDNPRIFNNTGSMVHLTGFKKDYQESAAKTTEAIAREIFEHCIWYFLRPGGAPNIIVCDDDSGEEIFLRDFLENPGYSNIERVTFDVKSEKFDLLGIRLKPSARHSTPRLYWCAASRVVKDESIAGKVPGLYGRLKDETSTEFTYVCYLSSQFLDDHVRSDRTEFDLPETIQEDGLINEISLEEIKNEVFAEIARNLEKPLSSAKQAGHDRLHQFVSTKAPKYRPVLRQIEERGIVIDPSIKDQDLELELHRYAQKIEAEVIAEGHAIFDESSGDKPEGYDERLNAYLEKVKEFNQSDLANYVFRRRTTLDILTKLIQSDGDGKYSREETIHKLLFPMQKDSTEVGADATNLWILDERLVFHDYLASDKTLKSINIVDDTSKKRPDIFGTRIIPPDSPVLSAEGKKQPLQSIVIVELKRPMRDDATGDNNPIEQCLDYVGRIRDGNAKTATGRTISLAGNPPAFCYVIADLTPTMKKRCEHANLTMTYDGMGYFGFNASLKAYIEVISFDRLVNAATERNRAFFDKLGLPSS